jgi:hypothetical protein
VNTLFASYLLFVLVTLLVVAICEDDDNNFV